MFQNSRTIKYRLKLSKSTLVYSKISLKLSMKEQSSLHSPGGADLVRMLSGVVGCQNISSSEHLLTDYTGMSHVQVNFSMPLYLGLIRHVLSTFQTGVSPTPLPVYHGLHHSVQL